MVDNNSEHNLVHYKEYTYFSYFSKAEIEAIIKKTTDIKPLDRLFSAKQITVKFKKNFIVFFSKVWPAVGKIFYCSLNEVENGTVISGKFVFHIHSKAVFLFFVLLNILGFIFLINIWNDGMGGDWEKKIFLFFLLLFLAILFLVYKNRKSIGKKDKKIILKYIEEVLEAEKVDQR